MLIARESEFFADNETTFLKVTFETLVASLGLECLDSVARQQEGLSRILWRGALKRQSDVSGCSLPPEAALLTSTASWHREQGQQKREGGGGEAVNGDDASLFFSLSIN